MTMTDGELLAKMGTDAQVWAQEFMRLHGDSAPDEGNMIGWFANAIMAGVDSVKRCEEAERLLADGVMAFNLTREYVGEDVLPAIEGWSWFDWCTKAEEYLRDPS